MLKNTNEFDLNTSENEITSNSEDIAKSPSSPIKLNVENTLYQETKRKLSILEKYKICLQIADGLEVKSFK